MKKDESPMKQSRIGRPASRWAVAVMAVVGLVVTAVGLAPVPPVAADVGPEAGSLDLSFGGSGMVVTPIDGTDQASALAIQPDGRIVVVGFSVRAGTGADFTVVRYNVDGSLDGTFGDGGVVVTPIGPGASRDEAFAVALQPDGRIVVAGDTYEGLNSHAALARYNPDGTLDSTFGGDGTVVAAMGARDFARAVAIQGEGRIVVAGAAAPSAGLSLFVALTRLNADGTRDVGFAGGGTVITTVGNQSVANAAAIQPDGRIVVAGQTRFFNQTLFAVLRYNPDGGADTTFGDGGRVVTEMGTGPSGSAPTDIATAVDLDADGPIVVAGFSSVGSSFQMAVVRYRSDGGVDPTFGGDGVVTTLVGTFSQAFAVAVDTDGRILVAGDASTAGNVDIALLRYQTDGTLDAAFGTGGVVRTPVGSATDRGRGIAVQGDGRIVVAGHSDSGATQDDVVAVRYHGDQPPDITAPETLITAAPGALTSDATPTFEFAADEAGSSFECSIDGAGSEPCASPHTTVAQDGPHVFAVRATDPAGNTDPTPASHVFTVDTTPPETVITSGPDSPTDDTTPTFMFSSNEAGSTFACQVDGGTSVPCDSPYTTAELGSGTHIFEVRATDGALNTDPNPATMTFRVCAGPRSGLAIELDRRLRPFNPTAADRVLDAMCTEG